jgi:hypothetical protein
MTPLPLHLVYSNCLDSGHRPSRQSPCDGIFDRAIHSFPGGMEYQGDFQPRQSPGPTSQEPSVGHGHLALAVTPRNFFDDYTALRAVNASHGIDKEHSYLP